MSPSTFFYQTDEAEDSNAHVAVKIVIKRGTKSITNTTGSGPLKRKEGRQKKKKRHTDTKIFTTINIEVKVFN